jgi:hypothetical protein
MTTRLDTMLRAELNGIKEQIRTAPSGTRNKIDNRCRKITLIFKKMEKIMNAQQKFIARQAIFEAMTGGRKLSQMDCREFEIEDMRTPMSHMKERFNEAGYDLHSQLILTPKGRRIKEYWLERKLS